MKTFTAKPREIQRDWYIVDATGQVLGRVAAEIARRLRGKHKPEFTPHVDTGDYIVVVNAEKLRVTGNKAKDKPYHRHTTIRRPFQRLRKTRRSSRARAHDGGEIHAAKVRSSTPC